MTTLTAPTTRRSASADRARLTFGTTMAAEWEKLFTLRSTYYASAALVLLSVSVPTLTAAFSSSDNYQTDGYASAIGNSLAGGVSFSQLVMGVMAVLIMSSEYSTGLIQSTLVAVPRRGLVLISKTIVAVVTAIVLAVVSWGISAAVAVPIFRSRGISASMSDPEILGGLATFVLYMIIVALFGVFTATVLRSSAASIATVVGVLFVLPIVGALLPESVDIGSYILGGAAQTVASTFTYFDLVKDDLVKAIVVVVVWLGATGAAAGLLFTRRDA